MSLRAFHLVFVLFVIIGGDLFGAWGVYDWYVNGHTVSLFLGILTVVGTLGLAGYIAWFVQKMDRAHIQ